MSPLGGWGAQLPSGGDLEGGCFPGRLVGPPGQASADAALAPAPGLCLRNYQSHQHSGRHLSPPAEVLAPKPWVPGKASPGPGGALKAGLLRRPR